MLDFGKNRQARMRLMDEWGMATVVVPGKRKIYYANPIGNTGENGLYEMFDKVFGKRPDKVKGCV